MKNFDTNEFLTTFPDLILAYARSEHVEFVTQSVADRVLYHFTGEKNFGNCRTYNDRLFDSKKSKLVHVYHSENKHLAIAPYYGMCVLIFF